MGSVCDTSKRSHEPASDDPTRVSGSTDEMRRLVASALLVVLSGCSQVAPAAQSTALTPDNFVKSMRGMFPSYGATDPHWIALGHSVCQAPDKGHTPAEIRAALLSAGCVNEACTRIVLRASVATFCPQHDHVVPPES